MEKEIKMDMDKEEEEVKWGQGGNESVRSKRRSSNIKLKHRSM